MDTMARKTQASAHILQLQYLPPAAYELDVHIFSMSDLRDRLTVERLNATERLEFYMFICITEGQCVHTVDFDAIACERKSLIMLQPGQIQRFDTISNWNGWMLLFRPEFLFPKETTSLNTELKVTYDLVGLPVHLALADGEYQVVVESITRMFHDTRLDNSPDVLHVLLRNQLLAFVSRLHLISERFADIKPPPPVLLHRFQRYRLAVEQNFHCHHQVGYYAGKLGYSEKSLGRAVMQAAGMSAKCFLSNRIALEARRFLAYTDMSVSLIANHLGFTEATNFTKFFRKHTGFSPCEFRRLNNTH